MVTEENKPLSEQPENSQDENVREASDLSSPSSGMDKKGGKEVEDDEQGQSADSDVPSPSEGDSPGTVAAQGKDTGEEKPPGKSEDNPEKSETDEPHVVESNDEQSSEIASGASVEQPSQSAKDTSESKVNPSAEDASEDNMEVGQPSKEEQGHPQENTPASGASSESASETGPEEKEEQISQDAKDEGEEERADHDQDEEREEDDHEEEHQLDYSNYTKKQMVQVLESMLKDDDFSHIGKILKEIKPAYEDLYTHEREEALKRFLEEGGEKDGFEFKDDELDIQFHKDYEALKQRRNEYYNSLEKQREDNLKKKQDLLEKLRDLVDADETTASISDLKKIQQEWRNTGPVAPQHMKSLWANYNALLDRYYDNRSIYFELKELDRKKNLELKLELCEKAEKLAGYENIKDAIKELNELHEEFKFIGPVPKEDQEPLWQRFKAASDEVYSRRKEHFENLREQFKLNLLAKEALVDKVHSFGEFQSDRITDWNAKTREILQLQKEWESIGGLPKEKAKKINKAFWSTFKSFFNHKGLFFKKLEESRKDNLEKKEALLEKAEALKDSDDFIKTAETLKALQRDWKDIGPVPEKHKDEVYKKFKAACDHFFDRRRENQDKIEEEYVENLKEKEKLCEELEQMEKGKANLDRIDEIQAEYEHLGYVPKNAIKSIQRRFSNALADALDQTELGESEKHKLKFKAQFNKMNFGPNSDKFLQKKENAIRRQISKLENDISLWKNNMDFFADSKNADKVKEEFNKKINKASKELRELKDQLDIISNI